MRGKERRRRKLQSEALYERKRKMEKRSKSPKAGDDVNQDGSAGKLEPRISAHLQGPGMGFQFKQEELSRR